MALVSAGGLGVNGLKELGTERFGSGTGSSEIQIARPSPSFSSDRRGYPHGRLIKESERVREKESAMGIEEKAKDKAQEAKGKVKEKTGEATDDRSLEAEGKGEQVKGDLKQAGEKVKDAFS